MNNLWAPFSFKIFFSILALTPFTVLIALTLVVAFTAAFTIAIAVIRRGRFIILKCGFRPYESVNLS
jgi:hypothetical protein